MITPLNRLLFAVFASIVAIIVIRLLSLSIGANSDTPFVNFWMDLSYIFVGPFDGIFSNLSLGGLEIELFSVIACIFYVLVGSSVAYVGFSFTDRRGSFLSDMVGFVFKIVETVLALRFILKLIGANGSSWFVQVIYDLSAIVYEPFVGIMGNSEVAGFTIEWSTLLILVIVIIIDEAVDGLLRSTQPAVNSQNPSRSV